jgi:alpha-N-arabinofuranosidase
MFGRWQLGYMQLNHYTLKHNQVEAKMREVDPGIFTVATGNVGDWSKGMLTRSADYMDALSEHFYKRDKANVAEHVQQIPDNIRSIAEAHREYRKTIPALQGKDIRIALDEWNYWYGPHPYGELGTRYFLKDALGIAAGLHEYFRNSDIYLMANYAQTVNVIGCIKTTKTHAEFAATGLPLMLYRREFGTIPVEVTHDKRPLDISAALTADKQAITIGVVNPTSEAVALSLNLKGANLSGTARTWVISGNDPEAYNVPGEPRKVTIDEADATHLKGTVTVKPMSITLYRAAL